MWRALGIKVAISLKRGCVNCKADKIKRYDITALGYCSIDHLCLIPKVPEDDKVEISELLISGGGPAATAAITAARLGASTAYLGAIGDDENGKQILKDLKKENVQVSGVMIRPGAISPAAYCWVEGNTGKRSIAWSRGSVKALRVKEVKKELICSSRILLLDGHHPEAAIRAAKLAKKYGTKVLLDGGTFRPHMKDLMDLSDVVIASEVFARQMTGSNDVKCALMKIYAYGPEWAVITLGAKGSLAYDGKKFFAQKSFKINVVDTTGAGDVYHGAFAYKYLACKDLAEIMRFSSAVAAMKCRKLGGRNGIPKINSVEDFMRQRAPA